MKLRYEYEIAAGHRILDYSGKCRFLHGHNYFFVVEIETEELDEVGFVIDFNEVKSILLELDHRTLLRRDDPLADLLEANGQPVVRMNGNPSAENIAIWVGERLKERLGNRIRSLRVVVWENRRGSVEYTCP